MNRHEQNNRGYMGIAIFAVVAVFTALHIMLPQVTLWPLGLVCLVVVTMIVSHIQRGSRHTRSLARSSTDNQS
jgi:hypothetical protein